MNHEFIFRHNLATQKYYSINYWYYNLYACRQEKPNRPTSPSCEHFLQTWWWLRCRCKKIESKTSTRTCQRPHPRVRSSLDTQNNNANRNETDQTLWMYRNKKVKIQKILQSTFDQQKNRKTKTERKNKQKTRRENVNWERSIAAHMSGSCAGCWSIFWFTPWNDTHISVTSGVARRKHYTFVSAKWSTRRKL